jgi:glycosyltransferase involved in cell wall biosynthesis
VRTVDISVVICTFERADSLARTLASLAEQVVPETIEWEALIVDNNSHDNTRQVAEEFVQRFPGRFRYLFEPNQGKSHALNLGVREAGGSVVAFTDDDVIVTPNWLHNLAAPLQSTEWAGAGGRTLPEQGLVLPGWFSLQEKYAAPPLALFDQGERMGPLDDTPFGNNMAFRKSLFERYGNFRSDLGPCAGSSRSQKSEDSEFGTRLLGAGERLVYQPEAVVYHAVPAQRLTQKYFLSWWLDKAQSDILAFGAPSSVWRIHGVPLRFVRRLVIWMLRWITATDPKRRFDCKVRVWTLIGQIKQCYIGAAVPQLLKGQNGET